MDSQIRAALREGLVDALGFVAGGLAGGLLARVLGFDFLADNVPTLDLIVGALAVGLGAGLARKLARRQLLPGTKP
jgi:hypothetical protein